MTSAPDSMRTFQSSLLAAALTLALVASLLTPSPGLAQNQGFALNRFDIAEAGSDWFAGDSLDLRGSVRPAVRLALDWAHKPLVHYDADGNELGTVIDDQVFGHAGVALILWERLRLGANLPVLLSQSGQDVMVGALAFGPQGSGGLGDLRLAADLRLLGEYGGPFTMALGAQLHLPTGDRDAFAGDGKARVSPRLMIAGDVAAFAYSLRAGFSYRPQDEGFGAVATGSEVAFVATAGLRAVEGRLLIGPELWGSTVVGQSGAAFEQESTPFELLFGAHFRAGGFRLGAGVGPGLNHGMGAPEVRFVASVAYMADAADRDEDGILDGDDACPDVAGPPNDDPKKHGCPDRDGDDIIDPDDACPDTAGVSNPDPTKHGCPPDRDDDGIYDDDDACPDTPGVASDDPDKHGCPPDRDDDGIYDDDDACPDTPGVASDDPRKNGCPPDRDGDRILDEDDACPDEPGPANDDPSMHGCPIARVVADQIKITQRIEFETDKARILPESEVVLEAVLAILEKYENITQVRVEGHTDNVGKAAYNRRLSQKRAASVVKWLVGKGIDRTRLISEGLGLTRPIASNDDEVGRQKNRRVEFHIIGQDETGDEDDDGDEGRGDRDAAQGGDQDDDDDDGDEGGSDDIFGF